MGSTREGTKVSFFRFRDKAKIQGKLKLPVVTRREALFNSLPRWYRDMARSWWHPKTFNREHEAERRRRQIERGILKVT